MADDAIGVFDSGVGGLTVVREIRARLPHLDIFYFGDTARVPYGSKSPKTVQRYAAQCADILLREDIALMVVACNTASAYGIEQLQQRLPCPVVGVVEPGARAAANATRSGTIGVIGTDGTIGSGAYQAGIAAYRADAEVRTKACPLFVPLAEEGWTEGPIPEAIAEHYLADLIDDGIDVLLLGCTHYPLLRKTIGGVVGGSVHVVDSAGSTADTVRDLVAAIQPGHPESDQGRLRCLVSDNPDRFRAVGTRFLGYPIEHVEWVDF